MKKMKKYLLLSVAFLSLSITQAQSQKPSGYTYGTKLVSKSPFTLEDLKLLEQSMLFTDEDVKYLKMSHDILIDQTDAILDVWYGFVGGTPQLLYFFGNKTTGKPEGDYLAKVRERFRMWILQTAEANYNQDWLNYQYEIGLRHYSTKKNKTDNATAVPIVNYRYIPALTIPVTATLKPFLAKKGASAEDVEKMYNAWVKSVLLQSILWGQPYIKKGEFSIIMKATLYHDGCEICANVEKEILDLSIINSVNISIHPQREQEARKLGVKVFPAIVINNGNILHINVMEHEGNVDCLLN